MSIYIVMQSIGQYSARSDEPVCAFYSQANADDFVSRMEELLAYNVSFHDLMDTEYPTPKVDWAKNNTISVYDEWRKAREDWFSKNYNVPLHLQQVAHHQVLKADDYPDNGTYYSVVDVEIS